MGFNRRKVEDQRRQAAEKDAANRRATDAQAREDAERLIAGRRPVRAYMNCSSVTSRSWHPAHL
jgi:hypothetical protein